jgi:pheromone shutdown protein TraB
VLRSVALGGQSALLLRVLLANLAGLAADELGVQGGGEFVAARRAGEDVGAQIVLGDRPIEMLERAWEALPWRARLRLTWELLLAGAAGSADRAALLNEQLVESMKADDAISAFFEQLGQRYPDLMGPLVHERDMYLAWSLRRSSAVNGASCVVGVVGRGHLRGCVHALGADSGALRFSDLVGGRNSVAGRRERAMKGFARLGVETALVAGAFALYTAITAAVHVE